jgi:hypothetical protein
MREEGYHFFCYFQGDCAVEVRIDITGRRPNRRGFQDSDVTLSWGDIVGGDKKINPCSTSTCCPLLRLHKKPTFVPHLSISKVSFYDLLIHLKYLRFVVHFAS